MAEKKIFQEHYGDLVLTEDKILRLKIKGMIKLDEMKKIQSTVNDFIAKNGIKLLLVEQTELKILLKEVLEHLATGFDGIEKLGVKKIATVEAKDVFAIATTNKLQSEAKVKHLAIRSFKTEKEAREWLLA